MNSYYYQERRRKMTQEERDAEDKALGESLQSGFNASSLSLNDGQTIPNNINEFFDRFREQDKSK